MKSENVIRSPLLLFNYYFLTQYVLLSKNKKALLLLFNFSLLTQYVLLFFCLKTKRNILILHPLLLVL